MYIVWRGAGEKMKFPLKERADPRLRIRIRLFGWDLDFRKVGSGLGFSDGMDPDGLFDGLYLDPVFPKGFIHCSEGLDPVFPKGWIQIRFFRNVLTNVKIK